jgi:uroporphyrin-III C-methyltransferase
MEAKLTLVGAGPGDPELISLKGIKAIAAADVILYDALVDESLLEYAKKDAIKIYVGKRANQHSHSQDEINKLIVDNALKHGHVVRLKGGDPFVFARGYEELAIAKAYGIKTESVIGISSVNLSGLYDIPLTSRGTNESFWVVTATTCKGELSKDVTLVAQSTATGIFLMGLGKLKVIVEAYRAHGKDKLPVAIISRGSRPDAQVIKTTMDNIVELAEKEKIQSPAIIVAGEVVGQELEEIKVDYLNQPLAYANA